MNTTPRPITSADLDGPQGLRAKLHAALQSALPMDYTMDVFANTGGGCRAIEIQAPNDRELLLTNGDAWVPLDSEGDEVVILNYYQGGRDANGYAVVTEEDGTLTLEIHTSSAGIVADVAHAVRAWVSGDPLRDA